MKRKRRITTKRNTAARKLGVGETLSAFIDANAAAFGVPIDKAWKPAIRSHLAVILRHGTSVQEFSLPDDAEPAPVFEP